MSDKDEVGFMLLFLAIATMPLWLFVFTDAGFQFAVVQALAIIAAYLGIGLIQQISDRGVSR